MKTLLQQNRQWAAARTAHDPHFFEHLVEIQRPDYLWIGCSDSRVPANEIVGLAPGELFVHRNVANIVLPDDPNCMAVVQYAVETLNVRDVIVCGHYFCGGVRAALSGDLDAGSNVGRWLAPLQTLLLSHDAHLDTFGEDEERWNRACELNVIEQVRHLLSSDVLLAAREAAIEVSVHGLIYSLRDGLLHELVNSSPDGDVVFSSRSI